MPIALIVSLFALVFIQSARLAHSQWESKKLLRSSAAQAAAEEAFNDAKQQFAAVRARFEAAYEQTTNPLHRLAINLEEARMKRAKLRQDMLDTESFVPASSINDTNQWAMFALADPPAAFEASYQLTEQGCITNVLVVTRLMPHITCDVNGIYRITFDNEPEESAASGQTWHPPPGGAGSALPTPPAALDYRPRGPFPPDNQ